MSNQDWQWSVTPPVIRLRTRWGFEQMLSQGFFYFILALGRELFQNIIIVQVEYSRTEYHYDQ